MSDQLDFIYSLDVARLTGPAGDAARALGALDARLAQVAASIAKLEASGAGLGRLGKAFDGAGRSSSSAADKAAKASAKIAAEWERLAEKAERAEQKKTAAIEREAEKQAKAAERAAERMAKAQAKADEKARHKSYYGGEKSIGELFGVRAEAKANGLATSAADAVLGGPAALIGSAFGAVSSVVSAGASLAYDFGRMAISAQAMRENSVSAFTAIYGSSEKANDLFDNARTLAKQTKFDTADVVKIYNTLAANNFNADELQRYSLAVADISSARGTDKGEQFLTAISKIRSSKTATYGNLQSAGLAGPGQENIFGALGQITGLGDLSKADWQKKLRSGSVTREQALQAVLQATAGKFDTNTGQLGEFAKAQGGGTWEGLISNIRNGLGDVLNSKFFATIPAMESFKTLLKAIGGDGGLFDETTLRGQRFAELTAKFVQDIFLPFGGITLDNTGSVMDRILDAGEKLEVQFHRFSAEVSKGFVQILNDVEAPLTEMAIRIAGAMAFAVGKAAARVGSTLWDRTGGALSAGLYDLIAPDSQKEGEIQSRATGGRVTGEYYGQPKLILAHVGEVVSGLQGEYADSLTNGRSTAGSGGGGDTYEYHFHGCNSQEAIEGAIMRTFAMAPRNNTPATTPG